MIYISILFVTLCMMLIITDVVKLLRVHNETIKRGRTEKFSKLLEENGRFDVVKYKQNLFSRSKWVQVVHFDGFDDKVFTFYKGKPISIPFYKIKDIQENTKYIY